MDHAQGLVRLFQTVNEDASFQHVCRVLDENSMLKGEIAKVRTANEFSDEKIIRLKTDLDSTHAESAEKDKRLATQARESDVLTAELNKKKKELAENSKQLSNLRSELKQQEAKMAELKTAFHGEQQKAKDRDALAEQLDAITNELRDRDHQLQCLGTLSFKLTPLPHEHMYDSLISYLLPHKLGGWENTNNFQFRTIAWPVFVGPVIGRDIFLRRLPQGRSGQFFPLEGVESQEPGACQPLPYSTSTQEFTCRKQNADISISSTPGGPAVRAYLPTSLSS